MRETPQLNSVFWVNCAILAGCIIYAFLVTFAVCNQGKTLSFIGKEIKRKKKIAQVEIKLDDKEVEDLFKDSEKRLMFQKIILIFIGLILWSGVVITIYVFFILNKDVVINLISIPIAK